MKAGVTSSVSPECAVFRSDVFGIVVFGSAVVQNVVFGSAVVQNVGLRNVGVLFLGAPADLLPASASAWQK